MAYKVIFHPNAIKELSSLEYKFKILIKNGINELSENPSIGIPLKGQWKPFKKHRIGNYRIIYEFKNKIIYILRIRHRREVYE